MEREVQCEEITPNFAHDEEQLKYQQMRLEEEQKLDMSIKQLNESLHDVSESIILEKKKSSSAQEFIIMSEETRKQYIDHLHQLKGHIRVFCRVRPVETKESCIHYPEQDISQEFNSISINGDNFIFNKVFTEVSTQQQIFEEVTPFLQSALEGDRVSIFAYGQTGSGKTYTMLGPSESILYENGGVSSAAGIMPRAGNFIFSERDRRIQLGYKFELKFSAIEIYNETIRDLITNENNLQLTGINEAAIKGLTYCAVNSPKEFITIIDTTINNRSIGKTVHNDQSSRSHCIMQFVIESTFNGKTHTGILNIIDLAGSERANKMCLKGKGKMEQEQMKKIQTEANFINKSLTALGRVLTTLADQKKMLASFRDSKLTRILQGCLQKEAKTLMFVNISPALCDLMDSKNSLRFAQTATLA